MAGRQVVGHAVVGEVGQRMAQRREFPIDDCHHPRLVLVDDQVADPEVAVDDGRGIPRHVAGPAASRATRPAPVPASVRVAAYCRLQSASWRARYPSGRPKSARPSARQSMPCSRRQRRVHRVVDRRRDPRPSLPAAADPRRCVRAGSPSRRTRVPITAASAQYACSRGTGTPLSASAPRTRYSRSTCVRRARAACLAAACAARSRHWPPAAGKSGSTGRRRTGGP